MVSSTPSPRAVQSRPVIARTETVRRGEVQDAEVRWRWLRRPQVVPNGWAGAVLEVNGTPYVARAAFHADDDGRCWLVADLTAGPKSYRVVIGQGATECDCPHATYRGCVCKHGAALESALAWLEEQERAEWDLQVALTALDVEATRPPF